MYSIDSPTITNSRSRTGHVAWRNPGGATNIEKLGI